jgi:hypothetical protein
VGKHLAWRLFPWSRSYPFVGAIWQAGSLAAHLRPWDAVMANRQLFPES